MLAPGVIRTGALARFLFIYIGVLLYACYGFGVWLLITRPRYSFSSGRILKLNEL